MCVMGLIGLAYPVVPRVHLTRGRMSQRPLGATRRAAAAGQKPWMLVRRFGWIDTVWQPGIGSMSKHMQKWALSPFHLPSFWLEMVGASTGRRGGPLLQLICFTPP